MLKAIGGGILFLRGLSLACSGISILLTLFVHLICVLAGWDALPIGHMVMFLAAHTIASVTVVLLCQLLTFNMGGPLILILAIWYSGWALLADAGPYTEYATMHKVVTIYQGILPWQSANDWDAYVSIKQRVSESFVDMDAFGPEKAAEVWNVHTFEPMWTRMLGWYRHHDGVIPPELDCPYLGDTDSIKNQGDRRQLRPYLQDLLDKQKQKQNMP